MSVQDLATHMASCVPLSRMQSVVLDLYRCTVAFVYDIFIAIYG